MKITLTQNGKKATYPKGSYTDAQRILGQLEESNASSFDLWLERFDSGFLQLIMENGIINACIGIPAGNGQLLCKYTDYDHRISYAEVEDAVEDFFGGNTNLSYLEWNNEMNDLVPIESEKAANTTPTEASKGGCYVATAVYGSYDCPQVWTLRRFRDDTLATSWSGRVFIRTYYALSPTLVKWFGNSPWFRRFWKGKLDRMVSNLNAKGVADTPYTDKVW